MFRGLCGKIPVRSFTPTKGYTMLTALLVTLLLVFAVIGIGFYMTVKVLLNLGRFIGIFR